MTVCPSAGLICSNGHTWRQQRRFCLVTLRGLGRGRLALEGQLQEEVAELAEAFRQKQGEEWAAQRPPPGMHVLTEEDVRP